MEKEHRMRCGEEKEEGEKEEKEGMRKKRENQRRVFEARDSSEQSSLREKRSSEDKLGSRLT